MCWVPKSAKRAAEIAKALDWQDKYYVISAVNHEGVKALCWDLMEYMNAHPREAEQEESSPEKVEFMWDDYHQQAMHEAFDDDDFDDWDESDEEGVEFIYQK